MLVEQIAKYLDAQGLGVFDETGTTGDIFINTLPSNPDECVAIYPTGGTESDVKLGYDTPTVELIVRGTQNPKTAINRAQNIYNTLHGYDGYFIAGGYYIVSCMGVQSAPNNIGKDENGRNEFSLNFRIEIKNDRR